ncbi:MAG: hypothetical protein B6U94_00145 [Thermofilum sp. ex4484_79]|nr:MAG: hypothetical protein B6U94_00145 [Thermofilum sp. ex4484_79]
MEKELEVKNDVRSLLLHVLERLEKLEELVVTQKKLEEAYLLSILIKLLRIGSFPIDLSERAKRLLEIQEWLNARRVKDDIIKSILEILALKGPMNLSVLTKEVRRYRGKASRRIIRKKISMLKDEGILEIEDKGREKVIKLKEK